jgi:selenide, water dikinase
VLRPLSDMFDAKDYPALLVGLDEPDDAAVYRVNGEQAIISTTDFFPPVVDDPYIFGAIAAANAMSDVYAMGGEVLFAINLAAFPDNVDLDILTDILRGGGEKVREAGAVVVGGHTVSDREPKYGLAVTGLVHPDRVITKGGAKPGDRLVLTKPLGSGVVTTALKQGKADPADVDAAMDWMARLSKGAAKAMQAAGAHAATDITGFGLLGHTHEMAHLSSAKFHLQAGAMPWLPGAVAYGDANTFAGGMGRNMEYFEPWVTFGPDVSRTVQLLLFDPQTSGGLLIAVAAEDEPALMVALEAEGAQGWIIGEVVPGTAGELEVT